MFCHGFPPYSDHSANDITGKIQDINLANDITGKAICLDLSIKALSLKNTNKCFIHANITKGKSLI